jgi:hypothetical protein
VCRLWASEEFMAKSMRNQECKGIGGPPGHTYGADSHVRTGQRMVRKIVTKNAFTLCFLLLTHTHRSMQVVKGHQKMKVWKRGHRVSDPSNPEKLCNLVTES